MRKRKLEFEGVSITSKTAKDGILEIYIDNLTNGRVRVNGKACAYVVNSRMVLYSPQKTGDISLGERKLGVQRHGKLKKTSRSSSTDLGESHIGNPF